jgi:hypothetical protein
MKFSRYIARPRGAADCIGSREDRAASGHKSPRPGHLPDANAAARREARRSPCGSCRQMDLNPARVVRRRQSQRGGNAARWRRQ